MKILYFNNGSGLGTAKSGGTTRFIETAKKFQDKGVEIVVVATSGAINLFHSEGLEVEFVEVKAALFSKQESSNFGRAWSYVLSTLHSIMIIKHLPKCNIVYSTSDYYCDVIPSIVYKIANKGVTYIAMVHHLCRRPNKRKGNYLVNLLSFLSQKMSHYMIAKFSDCTFVYDTPEGKIIGDYFKTQGVVNINSVSNGINYDFINKIKANKFVKYDACFVGGLRGSKGIYDLIPIWKNIVEKRPKAKLAVIGSGTSTVTNDLIQKIFSNNLSDNIEILGPLSAEELFSTMKSCNVFLSTSHEEGWGISICEALACGLPVVAFHLPAFSYLEGYIFEIWRNNHEEFSKKVIELLNDDIYRKRYAKSGQGFIKLYDWKRISECEYDLIIRVDR